MPTVTSIASYSLTNLGPLTTVFTPAPSCSTVRFNGIAIGEYINNDLDDEAGYAISSNSSFTTSTATSPTNSIFQAYGDDCASTSISVGNCLPSGSVIDSIVASRASANPDVWATGIIHYYSPGLKCPSDWSTVGLATKFSNGTFTSTGDAFAAVDVYTWHDSSTMIQSDSLYNPEPNAVLNALSPGETAIMCCPSGYKTDPYARYGYCISDLPSTYSVPTTLCANFIYPNVSYVSTTLVADGTTITGSVQVEETPISEVYSSTFGYDFFRPTEASVTATLPPVVAVTEQAVLYLIHQASDVSSAANRAVRSVGGGSVFAVGVTVVGAFMSGILLTIW